MFWLPVVEEFEVAVVDVESVGKASAAAARSAKKRSNSDDVNDSWSPCAPGCNINYVVRHNRHSCKSNYKEKNFYSLKLMCYEDFEDLAHLDI